MAETVLNKNQTSGLADTSLSNATGTGVSNYDTTKNQLLENKRGSIEWLDMSQLANSALSNITDTGTSTAAGWAMPSSTKEAITVGASGAQYQAPANGWFAFSTTATATNTNFTYLVNETADLGCYAMAYSGIVARGNIEVRKGDFVSLGYFDSIISEFCFVYAEGSKTEANNNQ